MRVAFLADIHGNLPALEAVLADLSDQSPDAVYLVGDQVNRCPWNNEVLDLIADRGWQGIRGNHELVLDHLASPHEPSGFDDRERFPDLWWTLEHFEPRHLRTIAELADELALDLDAGEPIRIVHGVPGNPFRGLFVDTEESDAVALYRSVGERIVICGHTHSPMHRTLRIERRTWRLLNGGSVGIPYNGDPRAQYLILTLDSGGWTPSFRRVEYPVAAVRQGFVQLGLDRDFGVLTEIYLRTIETAQPWASDFGHWLKSQPRELQANLERAVTLYEQSHGPGQWSFVET